MLTMQTEELLRRLRLGQFDTGDAGYLEQLKADELVALLAPAYPLRFQERRLGEKLEVGMARALRFQVAPLPSKGSWFYTFCFVPVLKECVFLSSEANGVTGISLLPRIAMRPLAKPFQELALTTSRGFKLDRLPDGWEVKPVVKKTVKLSHDFLQQRGWRFDLLQPVGRHP